MVRKHKPVDLFGNLKLICLVSLMVKHLFCKQDSRFRLSHEALIWPISLEVRTPAFQAEEDGALPSWATYENRKTLRNN